MATLTCELAQAFLNKFHYCDETGKRCNTNIFLRYFFFNSKLTSQLESLANQTTEKMNSLIKKSKEDNLEYLDELTKIISDAIEEVKKLRRDFASVHFSSAQDEYGELIYCDTIIKPKPSGKIEKELKLAINNMVGCFLEINKNSQNPISLNPEKHINFSTKLLELSKAIRAARHQETEKKTWIR